VYNQFFIPSNGGPTVENRLEKRRHHRLDLMYGCNDTYCPGMTLNISSHGMSIHAESQMIAIAREIKLVMTIDGEMISMRGVVCWNSEVLGFEPETDKYLGVFIPEPHPIYVNFVESLN
jgi:hypothetical protein